MEKINVYYKQEVALYFNQLIFELYEKEYFGFLEDAIDYKNKIIDFIDKNIGSISFKNTPLPLISLGSYYIFYNSNKRTTWYIFFEKSKNIFLITHISNNHSPLASFLND